MAQEREEQITLLRKQFNLLNKELNAAVMDYNKMGHSDARLTTLKEKKQMIDSTLDEAKGLETPESPIIQPIAIAFSNYVKGEADKIIREASPSIQPNLPVAGSPASANMRPEQEPSTGDKIQARANEFIANSQAPASANPEPSYEELEIAYENLKTLTTPQVFTNDELLPRIEFLRFQLDKIKTLETALGLKNQLKPEEMRLNRIMPEENPQDNIIPLNLALTVAYDKFNSSTYNQTNMIALKQSAEALRTELTKVDGNIEDNQLAHDELKKCDRVINQPENIVRSIINETNPITDAEHLKRQESLTKAVNQLRTEGTIKQILSDREITKISDFALKAQAINKSKAQTPPSTSTPIVQAPQPDNWKNPRQSASLPKKTLTPDEIAALGSALQANAKTVPNRPQPQQGMPSNNNITAPTEKASIGNRFTKAFDKFTNFVKNTVSNMWQKLKGLGGPSAAEKKIQEGWGPRPGETNKDHDEAEIDLRNEMKKETARKASASSGSSSIPVSHDVDPLSNEYTDTGVVTKTKPPPLVHAMGPMGNIDTRPSTSDLDKLVPPSQDPSPSPDLTNEEEPPTPPAAQN